jgi:inosine-uridine nucleoside N-ribohydrolase
MKLIHDSDLNFPSDDSGALLLLLGDPRRELVACTAAAGNAWAEEVEENLAMILAIVGSAHVAIAAGPSHQLFSADREQACLLKATGRRSFVGAHEKGPCPREWIAGTGDSRADRPRGPELIVDLCRRFRGDIQLVCTGPLTNLARALSLSPQLSGWVDRVYIMGGNLAPPPPAGAEVDFNFWFDPESAHTVLASGLPILLLPADVCRATRTTADLARLISRFAQGRAGLFADEFAGMLEQHGADMPLMDQLLALIVRDPTLVTDLEIGHLDVLTSGPLRGRTTLRPTSYGSVCAVRAVDGSRVERLFGEALAALDQTAPQPLPQLPSLRLRYQRELARQAPCVPPM